MTTTQLRAGVFSRESKGKGSSIDDQERENLEACAELGADVVAKLRDKVGASTHTKRERVGWPKVVELVDSGQINLLVVWEVSRADRVMDRWVPFVTALAANGVRLHITSLETTYDPRKAAHRKALLNMGADAESETGILSERARKGIRGAILDGKPHGPAADGYTREYGPIVRKDGDKRGKRTFTEKPNERADIPREIITRVARRDALAAIERDLAQRGVRTKNGNLYTRTALKNVVRNVAYIGYRRQDDAIVRGNWDPIVREEIFFQANKVLDEPDRKKAKPGKARHLLSYLVAAHECPLNGTLRLQKRAGKAPRYLCGKDGCVSIDALSLEFIVLRLMLDYLAKPANRRVFAPRTDAAETAKAEASRLEGELEEVRTAYDNEEISTVAFGRKERILLEDIEKAYATYRKAAGNAELHELLGDEAFEVRVIRKRWQKLPLPAKRKIVTAVFESLSVGKPARTSSRWASRKDRFALTAERLTHAWRTK